VTRIAITGCGAFEGGSTSLEEMIFEAASAALVDAGMARDDVGAIVIAASDQTDGRAISSMLTAGPAGAYLNDETNVASSPGHAFALGCMQIESGVYPSVLVASWGKASESLDGDLEPAERLSAEPYFDRDGGLTAVAALAMQAGAYRARSPGAGRDAAAFAARAHGVGAEDVLASPLVAEPLRQLEVLRPTDGAYALVLSGEGDVEVAGAAWCSETYRLAERELTRAPHLSLASEEALRQAGLSAGEIDRWELHDLSADAALIACEALGVEPEQAEGGALAGEPPFGGGLRKLIRAAAAAREGDRAFVQIASGFAGQFQSAFVLHARA
jgi:acetyl-CoA C-acetyltransferase